PGAPGQELDDSLPDGAEVGPESCQGLSAGALVVMNKPEQDVLGADVVVAKLKRLAQCQLQRPLRPRRERDARWRRGPAPGSCSDLGPGGFQRDAKRRQRTCGDAAALVQDSQQDVLGADVIMTQQPGLIRCQDDGPACLVGKTLEHGSPALRLR